MNIFHCCVQKTASQWIASIFEDPRVQAASNLPVYRYEEWFLNQFGFRNLTDKFFPQTLPSDTVISPLYIDFETFLTAPKSGNYKTFFVVRDPRDIVVSWYFSIKYSHSVIIDLIDGLRTKLNQLEMQEGLIFSIQTLNNHQLFQAIRSWKNASQIDDNVLLTSFEELTSSDNYLAFEKLFDHCQIPIDRSVLHQVLESHKFENLAGRPKGQADPLSHYRKGVPGDWINFFTPEVEKAFYDAAGVLPFLFGYGSKDQVIQIQNLREKTQELNQVLNQAQLQSQVWQNELKHLKNYQQQLQSQLKQAQSQQVLIQNQNQQLQVQLIDQQQEFQSKWKQQQVESDDLKLQLNQVRSKLNQVQLRSKRQRQNFQAKLEQLEATIQAMESSKFWKLRVYWFQVKQWIKQPLSASQAKSKK